MNSAVQRAESALELAKAIDWSTVPEAAQLAGITPEELTSSIVDTLLECYDDVPQTGPTAA